MEQMVKYGDNHPLAIVEIDPEILTKLQGFQKQYLQKEPDKKELKTNKFANNSTYLPISFLEMTLDEIFFGLWQTKNFQTEGIANEIVGSIELWYFHPTAKTWLCRIGAGAVQIQFEAEYETLPDGTKKKQKTDITDISKKITNTLTKDYPHLKAECFRNACLSLGKTFGRDLNREFDDQYKPIITQTKAPNLAELSQTLIDLIDKVPEQGAKNMYKSDCKKAKDNGTYNLEFVQTMIKKVQNDIP